MAIYKPTDCMPSGQSFDALNDMPVFVECRIDTNNAIISGYSLEFFDTENNRLFPSSSEDVHKTNHITLVSDLKEFFDLYFKDYSKGYVDLNTGINGTYLKIPVLFSVDVPNTTFKNNVPDSALLTNGNSYRWRITLYQEINNNNNEVVYPDESKYYDIIVTSGKTLGSTNQRIQTALVADDEDIVNGLVLIDKYIQPVNIRNLLYHPGSPKDWGTGSGSLQIQNSGVRVLIENYDDIYGHIYPRTSDDNSFAPDQITLNSGNNGFRIYKNGNNPENLGASDKVYEVINYPVDNNAPQGNNWSWVDTPANLSQSHWKQVYTTTTNPSENGYRPFDGYPSGAPSLTIYGKERIIFNHMYTGGAYSGSGNDRAYLGSCYNGIFSPDPSAEKVDGEEKWNVTINWYRTTDANTWGLLLNKVVYVENGSTTPPDNVDGDVVLQSGSNAEITIGSTSGVLNQTPFMFVSERPIKIFDITRVRTDYITPVSVGSTNDIYLLETSGCIGEVLSLSINGSDVPKENWAYAVNTNKVFYTPTTPSVIEGSVKVVYKLYVEQNYTGVIFYNMEDSTKGGHMFLYIKPFVGIENKMILKLNNNYDAVTPIAEVDTRYWFIRIDSRIDLAVGNQYQICSCYRSGDLNEFGLYKNPEIDIHVYDSLGEPADLFGGIYYKVHTRAFSINLEYDQDDYILWEGCQWDLYTADRILNKFVPKDFVATTTEKYDGRLQFVFWGLDNKKYYVLKATIITNSGSKFIKDIILYADYEENTPQYPSSISFNRDDLCVEIEIKEASVYVEESAKSAIRVYKREIWCYQDRADDDGRGENTPWMLIGENALTGCIFKDYCVASGHHYEYLICRDIVVPGDGFAKEKWAQYLNIDVMYMGWSIVELHNPTKTNSGRTTMYNAEPKDVWCFKYNVSTGAQQQNISKTQQETLGSYPRISVGNKNFVSGSVSCLLGREVIRADYRNDRYVYNGNGEWSKDYVNNVFHNVGGYREDLSRYYSDGGCSLVYTNADDIGFRNLSSNQSVNMINAWKDVVYSGNPKLIRDEKGRMYIINITSGDVSVKESWISMPTEISFEWVEVEDANNVSVFENRATDIIEINESDLDEDNYIPENYYSNRTGASKIIINNPESINGFRSNAFLGCINITDIYLNRSKGDTNDLFEYWCSWDFEDLNANPIHVSIGENGNGVRIFALDNNKIYRICSSIGHGQLTRGNTDEEFNDQYNCANLIPTQYSVSGYKYLQDIGIDLSGLGDQEIDGTLPIGLFDGCSNLINVIIKNGNIDNGYNVDDVVYGAFANITSLQNVILNNISSIGDYAFSGCYGITSVDVTDCQTIGEYAFNNCTLLSAFSIPTVGISRIEQHAFSGCESLSSINIPSNILYIGESAFSGCYSASSIVINAGASNQSIGESAFSGCSAVTSVVIPSSVTSIGQGAFAGCSKLQSITIPFVGAQAGKTASDTYQYPFGYIFGTSSYTGGVATPQTYYGESTSETSTTTYYIPSSLKTVTITGGEILYGAFYNCSGLTGVVITNTVTRIEDYAFYNCSGISSVDAPDTILYVDSHAFVNCDNIKDISAPTVVFDHINKYNLETVTINGGSVLSNNTFNGCAGLLSVNIASTITSIGSLCFANCVSLQEINVDQENEVYHSEGNCLIETDSNILIAGCKTSVIPNDGSVTTIGAHAFYGSSITEITIPNTIVEIQANAFSLCTRLTEISIPSSISRINNNTFFGCGSLSSITIPNTITYFGMSVFAFCTSLNSVYYGGSISGWCNIEFNGSRPLVYANGFYINNTLVENLEIPSDVTTINGDAFRGYKGLKSLTIPSTVLTIDGYAFADCIGLNSADLSNYVGSIPAGIFKDCSGLSELKLRTNTTQIGGSALSGCTGLTTMWAHVNVIDSFEYKMNLQNVTVYLSDDGHGDVYNIPDDMLNGSTSITSVNIVGTGLVSVIGERAFYGCPNLSNIIINGVYTIGSYAFAYAPAGTITITPGIFVIYPGAFLHAWNSEDEAYFPSGSVWSITGGPEPFSINTNNYSASKLSQYLRSGYDSAYYSEYMWTRTQ